MNAENEVAQGRGFLPSAIRRRAAIDTCLSWFRACALCGNLEFRVALVCEHCAHLEKQQRNRGAECRQADYIFPVYSLFTWTGFNDETLRGLVYPFKRGWAYAAAREWMESLSSSLSRPGGSLRFAYPSSSKGSGRDHAWLLAEILSEIWGAPRPLRLELEAGQRAPQHQLSVEERAWRRFKPVAEPEVASWIFVDDVITSGATAMGAFMALGDPLQFQVWTLVCRPKLAGKSRL